MTLEEDTPRNLASGAIWSMANQGAHQLLALSVFLVTARFVPIEAFGIMAVCLLIVEAFRQIMVESIAIYLYSHKNPRDADYNAGFAIVVSLSLIAALLLAALSVPIARLLDQPSIASVMPWVSVLVFTTGLSKIHEARLVKQYDFKKLALRSASSITLGGGVGIYMAVNGYGIYSLIAQQIVTAVTALVFLWTSSKWRPSLSFTKDDVVSTLKYSRHISATAAVTFINGQSDTFFASYYLGAAATGIYNAAKRLIAAAIAVISQGWNQIALPAMADSMNSENEDAPSQTFLACVKYSSMAGAPIFFGLAALAPDAVSVLLGDKWIGTAPILAVMSLATYFALFVRYCNNVFLTHGKPEWQTRVTTAGAAASVPLFVFAAPFGLTALACAVLVKSILILPVYLHLSLGILGLRKKDWLAAALPSFAAALIMAFIVAASIPALYALTPLWRLAILIPLGAALYAALLYVFDRKGFSDLLRHGLSVLRP